MTYGIEISSETGQTQLSSDGTTLIFVDLIEHAGSAGTVYSYPELTGKQLFLMAVPFIGFSSFSVTYPGGVPTVTTLAPDWGTGVSQTLAYVFVL